MAFHHSRHEEALYTCLLYTTKLVASSIYEVYTYRPADLHGCLYLRGAIYRESNESPLSFPTPRCHVTVYR